MKLRSIDTVFHTILPTSAALLAQLLPISRRVESIVCDTAIGLLQVEVQLWPAFRPLRGDHSVCIVQYTMHPTSDVAELINISPLMRGTVLLVTSPQEVYWFGHISSCPLLYLMMQVFWRFHVIFVRRLTFYSILEDSPTLRNYGSSFVLVTL